MSSSDSFVPLRSSPFTFARLLKEGFGNVPDPRIDRSKLHPLSDILLMALCTILCGGDAYEHMTDWALLQGVDWLRASLGLHLPNGIPHHDTFRRVLSRVTPKAVEDCLITLASRCQAHIKQINVDGKELRRSFDAETDQDTLTLLSAWASDLYLTLGQEAIPKGSNEIGAMEALLAKLEISGTVVSADAMHGQKQTASSIRRKGGDYLLTVKGNQPTLLASVSDLFAQLSSRDTAQATRLPVLRHEEKESSNHGRLEGRRCHVMDANAWLPKDDPLREWKDLRSVILVERYRSWSERGAQKESESHTFYISSLAPDAPRLLEVVRSRWSIENSLHYVLDVVFGEDDSRVRKDHGPRNMALLRRLSVSIVRHAPNPTSTQGTVSLRRRRKMAGWSSAYLLQCLAAWPVPQEMKTGKEKEGIEIHDTLIDN
jgi:predicted transposase YbfD/YdcC